jgi:LysR family hydrogen peroxide-inducible transcriptional activator
MPDIFKIWQEKIGGVQLLIEEQKTEELLVSMERKELDLAILAGPVVDASLRTIPLFKEEILAYCPTVERKEMDASDLTTLHPWLLSRGNCLRTQMIQFCQLKDEVQADAWNYEGGNLELLLKMVDQHGGYSLVPEFFHLNEAQRAHLKTIHSHSTTGVPAREIIALVPNRTLKWDSIERLIREVQLFYNKKEVKEMEVLNWK